MAGDLFIKERLPDGTFGELKPAFPDGETTAEKLAKMQDALDTAILELSMAIAMGGME